MSLRKILKLSQTLAFRLTLWYAVIFTLSSFLVFLIIYITMSAAVENRTDKELLEDLSEISAIMNLKGLNSLGTEIQIEAESDGVERIFFRLMD